MELTLIGLQYSGKTTFVNVIAVSKCCVCCIWQFVRLQSCSDLSYVAISSNVNK